MPRSHGVKVKQQRTKQKCIKIERMDKHACRPSHLQGFGALSAPCCARAPSNAGMCAVENSTGLSPILKLEGPRQSVNLADSPGKKEFGTNSPDVEKGGICL